MTKDLFAVLAAAAATATSAVAGAPLQSASVRVAIADLDLATTEGRQTLDVRLSHAVRDLCGEAADIDLVGRNAVRQCRHSALKEARRTLDQRVASRSNEAIQLAGR